ncbi:unnamed protein product [Microthlaspi erraticum]|uniref:Uncharacterized protein n=1 Tax=Microthlaspi erraticum TaxID=1685480 RepID=A0A6D2HAV2_9BRAS|nr:unnamed protein product [Microthlaspi erraticum]
MEITNPIFIETKPEPNQIIRVEPESFSSIVTKTGIKDNSNHGTASFGSTFDFPLFGNQAVTYAGEGGTRDVSLTLGLQNDPVSLALSPVTAQGGPLYYGRDHMKGSVMLDGGDQAQNLPYRNLMGSSITSRYWLKEILEVRIRYQLQTVYVLYIRYALICGASRIR